MGDNGVIINTAAAKTNVDQWISLSTYAGGQYFRGLMNEVIILDSFISTNTRNLFEQYQSAKWGVALTPPGTGATEAAKAMAADGYSVFHKGYLEYLSQSANIALVADTSITVNDLTANGGNGILSLAAGRSLSLTAGAGGITMTNTANTLRTNGGTISMTATGGGTISLGNLDTTGNGSTAAGANILLTTAGGGISVRDVTRGSSGTFSADSTNSGASPAGADISLLSTTTTLPTFTSLNAGTSGMATLGRAGAWTYNLSALGSGAGQTFQNVTAGTWGLRTTTSTLTLTGTGSAATNITFYSVGDLTLNSGAALSSAASGDALVLAAAGNFINSSGSSTPITVTGGGRYLVYSTSPLSDTFGTPAITRPNKRYNFAYGTSTASLTAGQSYFLYSLAPTLSITGDAQSKTYGTANPSLTYAVTGLIDGDTAGAALTGALTTTATVSSAVGSYGITQGTLAASDLGYGISGYTAGTLTITAASLTVTATAGQTKVYGTTDPASYSYTLTSGSLVGSDSFSGALTRTAGENVSSYAIGQGSVTAGSNYSLTYVGATFSITPAALIITADSQSKVYGTANPTLTASYAGLVNGETAAVVSGLSLTTSATPTGSIGSYAITASGGTASNYTIAHGNGTLTITPAALSLVVNDASRRVGAENPAFSYTLLGLKGGDTPAVFSGVTFATVATLTSPAGRYAITASGGRADNYVLTDTLSGILAVLVPTPTTLTPWLEAPINQLSNPAPLLWQQQRDKTPSTPAAAVFDTRNPAGRIHDPYSMAFALGTVDDALEAQLLAREAASAPNGQAPRISHFKLFVTNFWGYLRSRQAAAQAHATPQR